MKEWTIIDTMISVAIIGILWAVIYPNLIANKKLPAPETVVSENAYSDANLFKR